MPACLVLQSRRGDTHIGSDVDDVVDNVDLPMSDENKDQNDDVDHHVHGNVNHYIDEHDDYVNDDDSDVDDCQADERR